MSAQHVSTTSSATSSARVSAHSAASSMVARLQQQTLYQRLGLTTEAINTKAVQAAHAVRSRLLRESYSHLSGADQLAIQALLDEAQQILSDSNSRCRYDAELERSHKKAGAKVEPAQDSPANDQDLLDRYRMQNLLAEGDRSQIYSGWDLRLNRRVIIKKMRREIAQTSAHRDLFRHEAELFAGCNAGNLVTILDYDVDSGTMVLERLSKDLSSFVSEKGCGHRMVREMLRDALNGLSSLHAHGVAHGRVELRHLLMDDNSGVKLAVTPGMTGFATALRPGPHAMHLAPELLNPHVFGEPNLAVDIYALGFVALELLCGSKLAKRVSPAIAEAENTATGWLLWHSSPTDHLPPLSALVPGIPTDLARLLTQMTSKQQHERFPNAQAARDALCETIETVPTLARDAISETDSMDAVDVIGTPPPLRPGYDYEEQVTWQDVFRNPRCLLTPQGRNHACGLGIICLFALSLIFMSFQTASGPTVAGSVESSEPESADEPTDTPDMWNATAEAEQPEIAEEAGDETRANAVSETHDETISQLLDAVDLSDEGRMPVEIDVPNMPAVVESQVAADPYADVRQMHYHPSNLRLRYVGSEDLQQTEAQQRVIRNVLTSLINRTNLPKRGTMPFAIHEHAVDPRAAFTLALVAYQQGQHTLAKQYCERSLRDAELLRCAFVLPVRLLSQLHVHNGDYSAALARCRSALHWINRQNSQRPDREFSEAGNHVAWWAGGILGFVESTRQKHTRTQVDLVALEAGLREICSDEQWTKFRIARCEVTERSAELLESHKVYLAKPDQNAEPDPSEGELESESGHESGRESGHESGLSLSTIRYASAFSVPVQERIQKQKTVSAAAGLLAPGLRISPYQFQSYRPCDIPSLADTTALSMN